MLDALAHQRRRHALYELRDADGAMAVESLADAVADDAGEQVVVSLHHQHLPRLADVGLVDYDARSGHARYAGDDLVASWLDRLADVEG